jgi:P27 family predicted phage terminase small subunit
MGRPPKPLERIKATQRDENHKADGREIAPKVTFHPDHTIPDAPSDLEGRGLVEWGRVWGAGWWLVRDQDYHWVEMIARAYSDIEQYRAKVQQDGLIVTGYAGQDAAHPLIAAINKCEQTIQKCLQVLGFSPTDRAKLVIRQKEARDALEEFLSDH